MTLLELSRDGGFKNIYVRMYSTTWGWSSECSIPRDWPAEGCTGARNSADQWAKQTYLKDVKSSGQDNEGLGRKRYPSAERFMCTSAHISMQSHMQSHCVCQTLEKLESDA